ncbi:MAG: hypothetical protein IJH87_02940, partial [Atopobiaceae bacterium]|nr:hypothetical protein [Atopobiaceae bacterium]
MADRIKFKDMPYERPDKQATLDKAGEFVKRLESAPDYAAAKAVFLEEEEFVKVISTLSTLCYIRHSIDTRDAFYDEEQNFWDEFLPELQEAQQAWGLAMLHSPFRAEFEAEYGTLMFLNTEIEVRTFSPEILPDLQQEGKLVTEYSKLLASAQIPFQDGVYTLSQLTPFKTDADDAVRLGAWKAEGAWYKEHQADFDRIYDELVHLRDAMGKKLGHADFIPLGYDRLGRNCYTKDDVEKFRA